MLKLRKSRVTPQRVALARALSEGGLWSCDGEVTSTTLDALTRREMLVWRMRLKEGKTFAFYTLTSKGREEAERQASTPAPQGRRKGDGRDVVKLPEDAPLSCEGEDLDLPLD